MNKKQIAALWFGVAALIVAAVIPPFAKCVHAQQSQICEPRQWHLLWDRSFVKPPWRDDPDIAVLAIEWSAITVVCGALVLSLKSRPRPLGS